MDRRTLAEALHSSNGGAAEQGTHARQAMDFSFWAGSSPCRRVRPAGRAPPQSAIPSRVPARVAAVAAADALTLRVRGPRASIGTRLAPSPVASRLLADRSSAESPQRGLAIARPSGREQRRQRNLAASFWIVHRDPRWREALRRLVGGAPLLGDPADPGALADAPRPDAILLGASGDFEAELAWAHRAAAQQQAGRNRPGGASPPLWLVLVEPRDAEEARRLFDGVPADVLPLSGDLAELRTTLRAALARRHAAALSERRLRDQLNARFSRWLGDLDAPELLAAIDPARRKIPLLVRGESGTGRGLLTRYLHLQAGTGGEAVGCFASVTGGRDLAAGPLLAGIVPEIGNPSAARALTVCVEEADALAPAVQRRLAHWIENGPPPGLLRGSPVRWMATAGDPAREDRLEPDLARALAGLLVRIPPLRERPAAMTRIAEETAREWIGLRGGHQPARGTSHFSDDALTALHGHAWPGNARELEAVVRRTLATTRSEPVREADLVFETLAWGPPGFVEDAGARHPDADVSPVPGSSAVPGAAPAPAEPLSQRFDRELSDVSAGSVDTPFRRLAGAVAHEVGNPLVGIRTFAQMLPSRFDDPEFREQFATRVEADTRRIEAVVDTLARLGSLPPPERTVVDVSNLISRLLQLQRPRIQERRLVVLEELDREFPHALGDADQLRFALGLLLEAALSWLAESGDLYVATTHQPPAEPGADAQLRILVRSRGGPRQAADVGWRVSENTLAIAAVEAVVRAHHGQFAVESGEAGETLVLIDLPAP